MDITGTINFAVTIKARDLEDLAEKMNMLGRTLKSGGLDYSIVPPDGQQLAFTAKILNIDDTFKSEGSDPVWGLAFTSPDILEVKNFKAIVGNRRPVRITIKPVITDDIRNDYRGLGT